MIIGILSGCALVAALVFLRSSFRVDNGNVAVLEVFGRFMRDGDTVRLHVPGLRMRRPWARVVTVSLAERSLSLDDKHNAIEALAADGTRIRVNARLRYRVAPERIGTFLAEAKDAREHLAGLFRVTVREQLARFEPRASELSAYTGLRLRMPELQQCILDALQANALEEFGVRASAVDILQIDPPEELVDALNAVITAESEANALVSRTELQCQQRMLSAEHAVTIANARAHASESEIRTIGTELATLADQGVLRDYVARRRIEVLGGSHRVYLNHQPTARS
ncbi:MAG: SPFH domain-containing protein [Deltaproteobacteria bacterium]|nr:SPFH domain-containing protein [Deltaproteobacteria bacterium]MCW5807551.1 SPFH domain-containing protein [Deltaproteobacteria bacterium]